MYCILIPGLHHLQYFIVCSVQVWWRKAWKIWSHVVMSGRHTGAVSDCTFHVTCLQCCEQRLPCECFGIQTSDWHYKKGLWDPSLVAAPCVSTWCQCTWPNLPDLPPPYLHTASNEWLEVGVAWEWGYVYSTSTQCWWHATCTSVSMSICNALYSSLSVIFKLGCGGLVEWIHSCPSHLSPWRNDG